MLNQVENSWKPFFESAFENPQFQKFLKFLELERRNYDIYPDTANIFRAYELCPLEKVKLVILGQDPYHGMSKLKTEQGILMKPEANGLAFSVDKGLTLPPSLRNIFKELQDDLGIQRTNSDLSDWASQGVLLLNTVLTVRKKEAYSHSKRIPKDLYCEGLTPWQFFTYQSLVYLLKQNPNCFFILWGNPAQKYIELLGIKNYTYSAHPSPLSAYRGFWGSRPFSKANNFLLSQGLEPINFGENLNQV